MRILGGHDFYDTALAFGRDENLVFVRTPAGKARAVAINETPLTVPKEASLTFGSEELFRQSRVVRGDIEYRCLPRILWFAGERYGAIQVKRDASRTGTRSKEDLWFWSFERFSEFLNSINASLTPQSKRRAPDGAINDATIKDFFCMQGAAREREWLAQQRISIALLDTKWFTRDEDRFWRIDSDGLDETFFQRRLSPYDAFQALSQWVGGVLPGPSAPTITINDDKVTLAKHGMDQWSFKKPPSKLI